jgi:hypothetical protein
MDPTDGAHDGCLICESNTPAPLSGTPETSGGLRGLSWFLAIPGSPLDAPPHCGQRSALPPLGANSDMEIRPTDNATFMEGQDSTWPCRQFGWLPERRSFNDNPLPADDREGRHDESFVDWRLGPDGDRRPSRTTLICVWTLPRTKSTDRMDAATERLVWTSRPRAPERQAKGPP